MNDILLNPVGYVKAPYVESHNLIHGTRAEINILSQYKEAMMHIERSEYIWVLCWLHQADRSLVQVVSRAASADTGLHGVFSLRSPVRPNPVSISLVKLLSVEGLKINVDGLDVFNDTPVVDIKPYIYGDSIFSPYLFTLKPRFPERKESMLLSMGLSHHREKCAGLALAVKMAAVAEDIFGIPVTESSLCVEVTGSPCLADSIQGITRARLANPARLSYTPGQQNSCTWSDRHRSLLLKMPDFADSPTDFDSIMAMDRGKLFNITE